MSVFQVKNAWYYCYYINGQATRGKCEGCTSKAEAKKFESNLKGEKQIESVQTAKVAYHEQQIIQIQGGTEIPLENAFEKSLLKPQKRQACEERIAFKRTYWKDFLSFLHDKYPSVLTIQSVAPQHAEEYISYIRRNGRYISTVQFVRDGKTSIYANKLKNLSPKTLNEIQMTLKQVFSLLSVEAGLTRNPFDFTKLALDEETRDIFSKEEVQAILASNDKFCKPLFLFALFSGLREGDICGLKWSEINLEKGFLYLKQSKTGKYVSIPIHGLLKDFLEGLEKEGEYVLPEHAKMYQDNRQGVSYRIKSFLESLGILTTRKPDKRDREISVKDLHSCRHTFASIAGEMGIPLPVVQSILGHMSPLMTQHYMAHVNDSTKAIQMARLADADAFRPALPPAPKIAFKSISEALKSVSPDKVPEIISFLESSLTLKQKKELLAIANS